MKKIILGMFISTMLFSLEATVLRNGVDVPQEKIGEPKIIKKRYPVVSFVEKIPGYGLYRTIRLFVRTIVFNIPLQESLS